MEFEELLIKLKDITSGVAASTKTLEPRQVFVCLVGVNTDGHDYAKEALCLGAVKIVCERDLGLPNQILVSNSRKAYAKLCAVWFGQPAKEMKLIGVTGTNGKTTVTTIIKQVLSRLTSKPLGLIGTIQNEVGTLALPAKYTTPDPLEFHMILDKMRQFGCEYVVLEASSHALEQQRLFGLQFEVAAFTNLTHDHLDFHKDMANYFKVKSKLFEVAKKKVVNIDNDYGKQLFEDFSKENIISVGVDSNADVIAKNLRYFENRTEFSVVVNGECYFCKFNMPGKFSVENALVVVGVLLQLGFSLKLIVETLCDCVGILGRSEVIYHTPNVTIIRDYAHGPDGLLSILKTFKPFAKKRLVLLFGCPGRRDATKRKKMGEIASKYADFIVLSSDNPRDEDEMQIINGAAEGIGIPHKIFANRLDAIRFVLENKEPGDLILIAGKGHENYQVLADCTVYFDEAELVKVLLEGPKGVC
ncbi:MAG: UDP-N-acetylmuramoyl-L-alanyl-D-glutamate--2,6-diaminopimelate ligase [Oscillospiraceae bacterium]|nr:UDP-N-acetylmuramoyl-L-alanyl-D-glutamate--2,6-diaminopimelate ligase [Oscillospiraceae bacterium]